MNKAFEDNKKSLDKQLKSGELSYNEYVAKLGDLEATRAETSKEANEKIAKESDKTQKLLDVINNAGVKGFEKTTKAKTAEFNEHTEGYIKRITDQKAADGEYLNVYKDAATEIAVIQGTQLATMILQGKDASKAFIGVALDGLQSLIPIFVAQIFGESASRGPLGLIGGALTTAALYALLAAAKSSVGAETGVVGIDGNYSKPKGRTDTIPLWVAKGESIINAESSTKYRTILEQINNGTYQFGAKEYIPMPHIENVFRTPQIEKSTAYDFSKLERQMANVEIAINEGKLRSVPIEMKEAKFKLSGNDMVAIVNQRQIRAVRRS